MLRWMLLSVLSLIVGLPSVSIADDLMDVKHTEDSVDVVRENIASEKALLLDVREPQEWEAGHLQVARLVPLSALKEKNHSGLEGVAKDKILYLHCRSGKRVLQAAPLLKALGYDVRPLPWGYDALVKEGFEAAPSSDQ